MRSESDGGLSRQGVLLTIALGVEITQHGGARTSCPPAGAARPALAGIIALKYVRAARSGGQDVRAPVEGYRSRIISHASAEPARAKAAPTSITRPKPKTKHSSIACLIDIRVSSSTLRGRSAAASLMRCVFKACRTSIVSGI